MTCDHRMGYAPAARGDWSGLEIDGYAYGWSEMRGDWVEARAPRPRRRYIGLTHMTKSDHAGRERDLQAACAAVFHMEQPGTLVYYTSPCEPVPVPVETDMIQGLDAKALSDALAVLREAEEEAAAKQAEAHARAMGEAHQQRMLKLQAEVRACVGMQQGDSGWRDWNDG